jgi:hypothetical protein
MDESDVSGDDAKCESLLRKKAGNPRLKLAVFLTKNFKRAVF